MKRVNKLTDVSISILVLLTLFIIACTGDVSTNPESSSSGNKNTAPVLNNPVILSTDSTFITLEQPVLSTAGNPSPTINAYIGPYIGEDGAVSVNGTSVSGQIEGPVDVSSENYQFTGLSSSTYYKIIVIAENSEGYSVKQIVQGTQDITPLQASVHVDAADILRSLPANLFGTQISYTDDGCEILDPGTLELYDGVAAKFAEMNLATVRFPGGSLSRTYHWWDGIGPKASRPEGTNLFTGNPTTNNYGIDEHVDFCNQIGAEATIIVNFETGTPLEAANWLEYCNADIPLSGTGGWTISDFAGDESAPPGYFAWLRGEYGHPDPYNIKNWEVANEVYDVFTKNDYTVEEYGIRFIEYYDAMKAIDATIKIAAIGYEEAHDVWMPSKNGTTAWNQKIAEVAGAQMDAINVHQYAPVSSDGTTFFFFSNITALKNITVPSAGDYEIQISARGLNDIGSQPAKTYPGAADNFANLSINVDGTSQATFSVNTSGLDRVYVRTINFPASGSHTLGIEMLNAAIERQVMMLGDVRLLSVSGNDEIIVKYQDQEKLYNSIMAAPLQFRENLEAIKQIVETESGRTDIELWVTEFNTFYNTLGYRINQQFQFKSAVAMADMALQQIHGGADIIQTHAMLNDFYFGMMHEAVTGADSSMFDTYSLIINVAGSSLLSSTVDSPTFDLSEDFGWVKARSDVPYLDVLPTLDGDELSVVLINKHPEYSMEVSLDIEGFNSSGTASLKTINADSVNAMDYNNPDDFYEYAGGKIGKGIRLNASHPIMYDSYNKVFPDEGTIEFWIQPEWDGNDGLQHPFMSIGNTFFLGKYHTNNHIYATLIDDEYIDTIFLWGDVSTVTSGQWVHVALTWDISSDYWALYINGVVSASDPFSISTFFEQHQPMVLGTQRNTRDIGLDGVIDELRISKVARSASDIIADVAAGNSGTPLTGDDDSTILFHFEDSLEDSVADQRTYITTQTIDYKSSGSTIIIPPCSISLLKVQR